MKAEVDLVSIERASSTVLAEELQSLLNAEGIQAFVDPYSAEEVVAGELYTEFTGVDVKVRRCDAAKARKVLEDARRAGDVLKGLEEGRPEVDEPPA